MMAGRGFAPTFELQNQNSVWHVSKTEPKLDFEASNKKKSKKSNKFNFHAGTLPAHCKNRKHFSKTPAKVLLAPAGPYFRNVFKTESGSKLN